MNARDHPAEQARMRKETGENTEMTQQSTTTEIAPADQIDDFHTLYCRQTGFNRYRVLSLGGDHPTAYRVDTDQLTCECPDQTMRKDTPNVCKHLAYALFEAPARRSISDFALEDLTTELRFLENALRGSQPQASPAPTENEPTAPDGTDGAESESQTGQSQSLPDGALDTVRAWLDANVPAAGAISVSEGYHGDTQGVKLDPDYSSMTDTQKETMKGALNSVDDRQVHVGFGDNTCETCGKSDGDFFYFFPAAVVRGGLD